MGYDFGNIRDLVRLTTGRLSSDQMSDNELNERINNYLQYEFSSEFKMDIQIAPYDFLTEKNKQIYDIPANYTNFVGGTFINGVDYSLIGNAYNYLRNNQNFNNISLNFYLDPSYYYQAVGEYYSRSIWRTGDGILTNFSQTAQTYGILAGSFILNDDVEVFTDNELGLLTGSQGGTGAINYSDGSFTVNFNTAPLDGAKIWLTYVQYRIGTPQQVLNFNNSFYIYPVPDNVYRVSMVGYKMPDILISANDTPKLQEWGLLIAYGTARMIFAHYGEMDRYGEMTVLYKEQVKYANRRDIQNTMNRSANRSN